MPASAPSSAFVTGGSGFIGGRLLSRLAREGARVRALARSAASAAAVEEAAAEAVRGDLGDRDSLVAGAEGCDVTFHLAAHVAEWGTREEFERGNVDGTRNALEASRSAGVRRFVHCGTEAAILAGQALDGADESEPLRPDSPALYSATKAEAEALVRDADGDEIETVVVRPRFVWGRGDTTLLPEIVAGVEAGRFAWVDGGEHRTSITHVENVVEGLLAGAERGRGGEAYFITDGDAVVFREFISELLRTQGVEPPERQVPGWLAGAIARGGELAWTLLPLKGSPPLTRFAFWAASKDCVLDDSKARAELGYAPVITRERGLAELVDNG
jgi:nucleoside-diphosphate-sugar epimerase